MLERKDHTVSILRHNDKYLENSRSLQKAIRTKAGLAKLQDTKTIFKNQQHINIVATERKINIF